MAGYSNDTRVFIEAKIGKGSAICKKIRTNSE